MYEGDCMMIKKTLMRAVAAAMSGVLVLTAGVVPESSVQAAGVDTSDWQKSVTIDFGISEASKDYVLDENGEPVVDEEGKQVKENDLAQDGQLQLKKEFGEDFDMAVQKEFFGNMLYANNTVQDLYGTTAVTKQKIGFDKVVPAGEVSGKCGEYFRDWVYAPDGEAYSFSVDLPVGQYHVNVYTGNKVKGYDNTTCVQFNDEAYQVGDKSEAVYYNQTSPGGRQFYIPNRDNSDKVEKVTSYIVDVKDNGNGYGTLKATFFDNTDNEAAHLVKASDVFTPSEDKDVGMKIIDTYEGTADAIDKASIADKVVTARLNGIEIAPVENPVHATKLEASAVDVEMEDIKPIVVDMGAQGVTDRVFYRSSNPEVVEVDNYYGEVTAKGTGEAIIYAYNSYLGEVKAIPYNIVARKTIVIEADDIENNEITLIIGEENRDKADIVAKFNSAESDIVEWKVADESVVKLGQASFAKKDGEATSTVKAEALKEGKTTITATRKDNNERVSTLSVNVIYATKTVSFTDSEGKELADDAVLEVEEDAEVEIGYNVGPENATNKEVFLECTDNSVVSAYITGDKVVIKGKKVGETSVRIYTRYSRDINDVVKVKVNAKPVPPTPTPTAAPAVTPVPATNVSTATPAPGLDEATVVKSVALSGKAKINVAVKKTITLKVTAKGTKVKKVAYKIKSGKKFIKVATTKKVVKITGKKKGTAKIIITVTASGMTKKFTRTIKVK